MKAVALKQVCRIVNGGTPKSGVDALWHGDVAWLTPAEMGKLKSPYIGQTVRTISPAGLTNSSAKQVPAASVILSTRAPIGHLAINTVPMAFNQGCRGLIPNESLDTKYLYYFLWFSRDALDELGTGTTFKELSSSNLANFAIPLPPLEAQRRIVAVLDEALAGIATATANAQKNLTNAHALFDVALEQVFFHANDDWPKRHLGDISREFGRGKSRHRPRNDQSLYGGVVPFIQTGDISRADHWLTSYSQTYNEKGLAQSRLWPKGTVCIAIVGATVGETAILDFEACFPDSVIGVVVDDDKAINEYVEYLLQAFKAILKEQGKGTARDNINLGTFEGQAFPFPDVKTQRAVVTRVSELREESRRLVLHYETRLAALAELKQSLLEKAFAGKLT